MHIGYTEEQEALRQELRAYYDDLLTDEVRDELAAGNGVGEAHRAVVRQMGEDGWLGIGWPEEYGGQGRTPIEQFIFFDESMRAGAPVPMLTINTVGPTIMNFGTDEQKDEFLPRILRARSTSASATPSPAPAPTWPPSTTRAVRDGEEYVINGQKIFTSLASDADYCWLAVRTNPDVKKHKGISMIIVPMDTPGIEVVPMDLLSEHDINQVFYEDVRVPADEPRRRGEHGLDASSPTSSTTSGSPSARPGCSSRSTRTSAGAPRRPSWPTVAGWSTRSGSRPTSPGSTPGSSSCASSTGRSPGRPPRAAARRGRRLDHQGARHRALPGGVPADDGDPRPGLVPAPGLARGAASEASSSGCTAASSSSPSGAAPTRCSGT